MTLATTDSQDMKVGDIEVRLDDGRAGREMHRFISIVYWKCRPRDRQR